MRNPESVLKNETQTSLRFWYTKTDHLISARQPQLVIVKKKKKKKKRKRKKANLLNCRIGHSGRPQSENKRKRKER